MMPQFAPVAPLRIHKELADNHALGNYHLLLAHQVLNNPVGYRDFWTRHPGAFIIMDNSLIELGFPLTSKAVVRAADIVGARVIVLPDIIADAEGTLQLVYKAIHQIPADIRKLGVMQGSTIEECFEMVAEMVDLGIEIISVPRHMTERFGSRIPLVDEVARRHPHVKMHLLGFSNHVLDDILAAHMPNVWGIDSAVPIWYGLDGRRFGMRPGTTIGSRPDNYWLRSKISSEVLFNIGRVRMWLTPGWSGWLNGAAAVPMPARQLALEEIRKAGLLSSERPLEQTSSEQERPL